MKLEIFISLKGIQFLAILINIFPNFCLVLDEKVESDIF